MWAIKKGNCAMVKTLIEGGVNVNLLEHDTFALKDAASEGQDEILKLLIGGGADVNKHDQV